MIKKRINTLKKLNKKFTIKNNKKEYFMSLKDQCCLAAKKEEIDM
jgi:hypothetical protein